MFERKPKKLFITLAELYAWAIRQDTSTYEGELVYTTMTRFFKDFVNWFNGTQTYYLPDKDENGDYLTAQYPNLDVSEQDLLDYFLDTYGDRLVAKPVKVGQFDPLTGVRLDYDDALLKVVTAIGKKADIFYKDCSYKYLTLVKTLGFIYNPIENYRSHEEGESEQEFLGSEEMERTTNVALGTKGWKVSGPATGFGQVDNVPTIDYAHTHKKVEAGNNLSTSVAGTGITGVTDATASTSTVGNTTTMTADPGTVSYGTGEAGNLPTTRNYTTTYDDSSDGRLKDYSTTAGTSSTANQVTSQSNEDEPAIGEIWGGTQVDPFTDTKSFNDRSNKTTHNLERYGNIGVTTSQQMIQSERDLARIRILDEFFKELSKEILLGVYGC